MNPFLAPLSLLSSLGVVLRRRECHRCLSSIVNFSLKIYSETTEKNSIKFFGNHRLHVYSQNCIPGMILFRFLAEFCYLKSRFYHYDSFFNVYLLPIFPISALFVDLVKSSLVSVMVPCCSFKQNVGVPPYIFVYISKTITDRRNLRHCRVFGSQKSIFPENFKIINLLILDCPCFFWQFLPIIQKMEAD